MIQKHGNDTAFFITTFQFDQSPQIQVINFVTKEYLLSVFSFYPKPKLRFLNKCLKFHDGLLDFYLFFLCVKNCKMARLSKRAMCCDNLQMSLFDQVPLTPGDQSVMEIPHFGYLLVKGITLSNLSQYNKDFPWFLQCQKDFYGKITIVVGICYWCR